MNSENLNKLIDAFKLNPLTIRMGLSNLRSEFESMSMGFKLSDEAVFEKVDADGVNVQWVDVLDSEINKVVIYIHGGGYIMGSADMYKDLATRIASVSKARVLLIDYKLAPENLYPSPIQEVITVYQWLLNKNFNAKNIKFVGDGAGAGLMLSSFLAFRSFGIKMPSAGVCISPWTDLALTGNTFDSKTNDDPVLTYELLKFCADNYVGADCDRCDPFASPFYADLSGLPPLLIMTGQSEILLDDSLRFARKAEFFGVKTSILIAQNMIHNWIFFSPILIEGQQSIDYIGKYLRGLIK